MKLQVRSLSKPFVSHFFLLSILIALLLVPWIAKNIASNQYRTFTIAGLFVIQIVASLRWWRLAVHIFFVYIMLEGFLINYFSGLPELNLVKDAQMSILFAYLIAATTQRGYFPFPSARWMPVFGAFAITYAASAFNPNLPTILIGLIGVRVTLLFVLCFAIGYWFFRTPDDVFRFLNFQAYLSVPISLFGAIQYFTGPSLLLSMSPGFNRAIFYAYNPTDPLGGTFFRTISTFASTSGFVHYLWATICLTLANVFLAKEARVRRIMSACLVLQICAAITTGSRGMVVLVVLSLGLTFVAMGRFAKSFVAATLMAVVFFITIGILGSAVQSRFSTLLDLQVLQERIEWMGVGQISNSMDSPLIGLGAGRLSSASYRLRPEMELLGVESQLAKIRFESGLFGLLTFLLFSAVYLIDFVATMNQFETPELRTIACFVGGYIIILVVTLPIGLPLDISPTNFYFWFLTGLIYSMRRFEAASVKVQQHTTVQNYAYGLR